MINEIRKIRLKKLETIEKAGFLVYPMKTKRTHKIEEATGDFTNLSKTKKEIILAGRIRSLRIHGGATFFHIEDGSASSPQDGTGKIQG